MININLTEAEFAANVTRAPAMEFLGRGTCGTDDGFIYEIELSEHLTLLLDEWQARNLADAINNYYPGALQ